MPYFGYQGCFLLFLIDLSTHLWLFIKDKLLEVYILDSKGSYKALNIDFQITPPKRIIPVFSMSNIAFASLSQHWPTQRANLDLYFPTSSIKTYFSIILFPIFVLLGRWKVFKKIHLFVITFLFCVIFFVYFLLMPSFENCMCNSFVYYSLMFRTSKLFDSFCIILVY